jgi:hypothetical protein
MSLPEFTAEATLYRTARAYRTATLSGVARVRGIVPQDLSTCGNCSCDTGKCCTKSGDDCICYVCATSVSRVPVLIR